jgi:hypothetical protein
MTYISVPSNNLCGGIGPQLVALYWEAILGGGTQLKVGKLGTGPWGPFLSLSASCLS